MGYYGWAFENTASKAIWYQGEVMQEDQKSMLKYYQHLSPIENSLIMFRLFVRCSILYSSQRPAITGATERIPDSTPYTWHDKLGGMGQHSS
jgi:hypothetical protein